MEPLDEELEQTVQEVQAPEIEEEVVSDSVSITFDKATLARLVALIAKLPIVDALDIYAGLYGILNKKDSA